MVWSCVAHFKLPDPKHDKTCGNTPHWIGHSLNVGCRTCSQSFSLVYIHIYIYISLHIYIAARFDPYHLFNCHGTQILDLLVLLHFRPCFMGARPVPEVLWAVAFIDMQVRDRDAEWWGQEPTWISQQGGNQPRTQEKWMETMSFRAVELWWI